MGRTHNDITGKRFGRLVTQRYVDHGTWECLCDCGKTSIVKTERLNNGHTKSCGCLYATMRITHGGCKSKTYRVWLAMRQRCENPKNSAFHNYGGRGIKVCDRWNDYAAFLADMGEAPPKKWVDRLDNERDYEPGNCEWATVKKNQNNKRTNRVLEFDGRKQTIAQWAEEVGLVYRTLNNRINRGWSVERALTEPVGKEKHQ